VTHYFLDTSAFLKTYIVEPGEKRVRGLVAGATADPPTCRLVVTDFTFVEAASAALQKRDQHLITRRTYASTTAEIERLLVQGAYPFVVVPVSSVVHLAPLLIRTYRIRPGDAVHIGAAISLRAAVPEPSDVVFVSSDEHQKRAARAEALEVWDPAE
jgi:predicted nucleic acid-binding protein